VRESAHSHDTVLLLLALHLLQKVCYWGDYHLEILPLVGFKFVTF
jgi:hypothetical protein